MTTAILTLLAGILAILVIIAANGYFVAQEFAYMSVDRSRLRARAEDGDRSATQALKVTDRTSFMLSGAQLGITVTGLLVGWIAEPFIGEPLGEVLGDVGVPAAVSISVGTILALGAATIIQMIFGELYPKNLAIAVPEPMARALARSTNIYLAVFGWLISIFDLAANLLLKLLRIEPVNDLDTTATAADLERIVADSRESGDLPEGLSILIDRILDFPERDVEHAMIPRARVDVVSPHTPLHALRELMAEHHSRYPVVTETGEPLGVVQLTDLLASELADDATVEEIMRPPLVVPELMSLPDALEHLAEASNELACVIDEFGGFAGILTVEDLSEEVVGELTDEHDDDLPDPIEIESEHTWLIDGDVHLDEIERAIGYPVPEGDYETIAGLVIATAGDLPEVGEKVTVELPDDPRDLVLDHPVRRVLEIEVLKVSRRVPDEIRVQLLMLSADGDGESDAAAEHPAPEDEEVDR